MIIYHPAYDINHCLYRMLLILESSSHERFEWSLMRLMDFYLLFPHLLKSIKPFPSSLKPFRKIVNEIPDAYEALPNAKRVIFELEAIQSMAVQHLIAKGLIEVDEFDNQIVTRTSESLPNVLYELINADSLRGEEWFRMIVNELPLVEFEGKHGIKARSHLMEYRYDG